MASSTPFILQFFPPDSTRDSWQFGKGLPFGQRYKWAFATPSLITWGNAQQNYIAEQLSINTTPPLGMITIGVKENSLIQVHCPQSFYVLLYTLEGYHFMHVEGQGALPLWGATYTLQAIMSGTHRLLMQPGHWTLLWIAVDDALQEVLQQSSALATLLKSIQQLKPGSLTYRPIDRSTRVLLEQLMGLTADIAPFALPLLSAQLLLKVVEKPCEMHDKEDIPAAIMAYIASHIHWPVPVLLQRVQAQFKISRDELDRYFHQLPIN